MNTARMDTRPWYREPWPWILMAGPGIVVIAGFITAWLAFRSNDGLVADDYYKQGLGVNQVLERDRRAVELGLNAQVMTSGRQLRVVLAGGSGLASPERLELKLAHPTRGGDDQSVMLARVATGFYTGILEKDVSGRRIVVLQDTAGQWRMIGSWKFGAEGVLTLRAGTAPAQNEQP